ncbi:RNA polymerase sigma-70 factor (ECF subfamily) [Actinomycetospora succinea]|uniref:RNA polymerase sigma-70 factor (ECF subfamily) n=1 Tax=Actinomycetospora succinea TaxID=663603 RepID=A0A4R6VJT4_9PSEU|nr:sigma-70 family RNA polymerase sigma factor [Actinomycetospora succinea]TDQ58789.1 RNA polymerase sigma-70 factor (ECF subfamily) [Actinomycetospora succinea]
MTGAGVAETVAGERAAPSDPDAGRVSAALAEGLDVGFAELYRAYHGVVFAVALRTTGHRADAEDLAAESLLRAYRALSGYDARRIRALSPRPWLLTIVLNTRRNQVRDAARRPRGADGEVPERPVPGPTVEEHAEHRETGEHLAASLAQLTDTQRHAVVLRHVADLPIGEVAEVLGCPVGTAKSHVSRGLTRLRACIENGAGTARPAERG